MRRDPLSNVSSLAFGTSVSFFLAALGVMISGSPHQNLVVILNAIGAILLVVGVISIFRSFLKAKIADDSQASTNNGIIATHGASVINASVVNDNRQYGLAKPLPELISLCITAGLGECRVAFYVNKPFSTPLFIVRCSVPYRAAKIAFRQGVTQHYSGGTPFSRTNDPCQLIVNCGYKTLLSPSESVEITIFARQVGPITVLGIEAYGM